MSQDLSRSMHPSPDTLMQGYSPTALPQGYSPSALPQQHHPYDFSHPHGGSPPPLKLRPQTYLRGLASLATPLATPSWLQGGTFQTPMQRQTHARPGGMTQRPDQSQSAAPRNTMRVSADSTAGLKYGMTDLRDSLAIPADTDAIPSNGPSVPNNTLAAPGEEQPAWGDGEGGAVTGQQEGQEEDTLRVLSGSGVEEEVLEAELQALRAARQQLQRASLTQVHHLLLMFMWAFFPCALYQLCTSTSYPLRKYWQAPLDIPPILAIPLCAPAKHPLTFCPPKLNCQSPNACMARTPWHSPPNPQLAITLCTHGKHPLAPAHLVMNPLCKHGKQPPPHPYQLSSTLTGHGPYASIPHAHWPPSPHTHSRPPQLSPYTHSCAPLPTHTLSPAPPPPLQEQLRKSLLTRIADKLEEGGQHPSPTRLASALSPSRSKAQLEDTIPGAASPSHTTVSDFVIHNMQFVAWL